MDLPNDLKPLVIRGGAFTFRTFADGVFGQGVRGSRSERLTVDKLVTVTLPAIDGEHHKIVPTMEVRLYPTPEPEEETEQAT